MKSLRLTPIVLVALIFTAMPAAAAVTVTLSVKPPADAKPGSAVPATVYFLNTGDAAETVSPPKQLPARLVAGGRSVPVTLTPAADVAAQPLEPRRFLDVAYTFTLPPDVSGTWTVELDDPAAARATVAVAPAVGGPAAGASGVGAPVTSVGGRTAVPPAGAAADLPAAASTSIAEYVPWRFSAHEPIYFIAGPDQPNAKFQVSFKYQVFNPEGELAKAFWPVAGIHVAYTQTSLWDLEADSAPFFDSSYKPELLWVMPELQFDKGLVSRLGLQVGFQHESNGKGGTDSRSLNFAYVRPSVTFGDRADGWFATVAPKLQAYVIGFDEGNADITDYRGFGELSLIVGKRNGLQLRTTARVGDDWDKGSVQLDLSYPIGPLVGKNVDLYLHAQYFNGFGESLLQYNESTSIFRVGLSIVR